jgi:hypothetical protein
MEKDKEKERCRVQGARCKVEVQVLGIEYWFKRKVQGTGCTV